MSDASRDNNNIPGRLACLNTDAVQGTNLVRIRINEATGAIKVSSTDTISYTAIPIDPRDQNYVGCWLFEGSDGLTYPAAATVDGLLLIDR